MAKGKKQAALFTESFKSMFCKGSQPQSFSVADCPSGALLFI